MVGRSRVRWLADEGFDARQVEGREVEGEMVGRWRG